MEFVNHTPFPALAFEGIDQHDQHFHVVVLRQTLELKADGWDYADEQAPLCEEDEWTGEMNRSVVRQESDYCHYKPRCDVIVNGSAHAPKGQPGKRFTVRLHMRKPDRPVPMPEEPRGLNPYMAPSPERMAAWREACDKAKGQILRGTTLIDKELVVTGPRELRKLPWPLPWLATAGTWLTLGLWRPCPWRLTAPEATSRVPMLRTLAFGGECRIAAEDPAAKRIPERQRIPDPAPGQPAAHTAYIPNPNGRGWVEAWYLRATRAKHLPAPQIEHPGEPFRICHFWRAVRGKKLPDQLTQIASLGVRPKGHPDRAKFTGTIDDAFAQSDSWLPDDFDFAVWNAAAPDQQVDFPDGGELFELTNLCSVTAPGAVQDADGNTLLRFTLPRHQAFVRVRLESGEVFRLPMQIDTVVFDTDRHQVTLVWRRIVGKLDEAPVRMLEAGTLTPEARDERDRAFEELDRAVQSKAVAHA